MGDWNPNEPELVGMEWLPTKAGGAVIDTDTKAAALVLPSTATETIDRGVFWVPNAPNEGNFMLEVYAAGNEVCGAVTTDTFRPNEDTGVTNVQNQAGAVVNLYQSIDESTLDLTDYIKNVSPPSDASYTCKLNTAAWPASGRRVVDVRVVIVGEQILGTMRWGIELRRQSSGFLTLDSRFHQVSEGRFTTTVSIGDINPFTGFPWTAAEIQSLDSIIDPDRLSLTLRFDNMTTIYDGGYVYQAYVEIDWVTENRLAVARGEVHGANWYSFPFQVPDTGADNWAKAIGNDYTFLLRRVPAVGTPGASTGGPLGSSTGQAAWGFLEADEAIPLAGAVSYLPTLDANGCVTAMGTAGKRGHGLVLRTTAPATSADGQPYDSIAEAEVVTGVTVRQEVTPSVGSVVELVRFLVKVEAGFEPDADLSIGVFNDGTGAAVGAPAVLTVAELADLPERDDGWKVATAQLTSPATLVAATQYRIAWTSATGAALPWIVGYGESLFNFGAASYGGTTDRGDTGGGYDSDLDFLAYLIDPPSPPANFLVTASTAGFAHEDESGCGIEDQDVAVLTWDATSLGADFGRYEIERSEDGGEWALIATQADESVVTFTDYGALRGVSACYRIRVVDVLEAPSPWSVFSNLATIVDDFNRADNATTMGTTPSGEPWVAEVGTWGIATNEAYVPAGGAVRRFSVIETGQTEGHVQAVVGSVRETGWGLVCRWVDDDNYIILNCNTGAATWSLTERVGGVDNLLAGPTLFSTAPGRVIRIAFAGDQITCTNNGADIFGGPLTCDPGLLTGTKHGLFAGTTVTSASRWENFEVVGLVSCVTPQPRDCELLFVSNERPDLNVGYSDGYEGAAEREYEFLDADRVVLHTIYGRDRQVAFQPTERLGDQFTFPILLNAVEEPLPEPGRRVFDAIVELSRAEIAEVLVLDSDGNRWVALLRVPSGRRREPGKLYIVPATVTEIAAAPTVVALSGAQVTP